MPEARLPSDQWKPGDRVRVREGVTPAHYVGRTGVVDHTNATWVYVQGAQLMGDAPAGFRPSEPVSDEEQQHGD